MHIAHPSTALEKRTENTAKNTKNTGGTTLARMYSWAKNTSWAENTAKNTKNTGGAKLARMYSWHSLDWMPKPG